MQLASVTKCQKIIKKLKNGTWPNVCLEKGGFFFSFLLGGGHFVTKIIYNFLSQCNILNFYTQYDHISRKKIHLSEMPILQRFAKYCFMHGKSMF
jgi:hypothetical protein